jgi:hypothetical protein
MARGRYREQPVRDRKENPGAESHADVGGEHTDVLPRRVFPALGHDVVGYAAVALVHETVDRAVNRDAGQFWAIGVPMQDAIRPAPFGGALPMGPADDCRHELVVAILRVRVKSRRPERNDAIDVAQQSPCQLPGVDTAEAVPDE